MKEPFGSQPFDEGAVTRVMTPSHLFASNVEFVEQLDHLPEHFTQEETRRETELRRELSSFRPIVEALGQTPPWTSESQLYSLFRALEHAGHFNEDKSYLVRDRVWTDPIDFDDEFIDRQVLSLSRDEASTLGKLFELRSQTNRVIFNEATGFDRLENPLVASGEDENSDISSGENVSSRYHVITGPILRHYLVDRGVRQEIGTLTDSDY